LEDLPSYRHWLLPRSHRWQDFDGPYFASATEADVEEQIAKWRALIVEQRRPPSPRARLVIARREDDALIGTVNRYWSLKEVLWPAAGLVLFDSDDWNQGLGAEALGLWIDYLFRAEPRIHRVDLRTWSGNKGMCRLAEKLGFLEEARFREAVVIDGRRYDAMGYGILRTEWESRPPVGA